MNRVTSLDPFNSIEGFHFIVISFITDILLRNFPLIIFPLTSRLCFKFTPIGFYLERRDSRTNAAIFRENLSIRIQSEHQCGILMPFVLSCLAPGLRRKLYVQLGPGRRSIPQRASDFTMGRHEIRLGIMRCAATWCDVDSWLEKTWWRSARSMGRRGARRRLSGMSAGDPPRRERPDHHAQYSNGSFIGI